MNYCIPKLRKLHHFTHSREKLQESLYAVKICLAIHAEIACTHINIVIMLYIKLKSLSVFLNVIISGST